MKKNKKVGKGLRQQLKENPPKVFTCNIDFKEFIKRLEEYKQSSYLVYEESDSMNRILDSYDNKEDLPGIGGQTFTIKFDSNWFSNNTL
jgi:hypothetical protein